VNARASTVPQSVALQLNNDGQAESVFPSAGLKANINSFINVSHSHSMTWRGVISAGDILYLTVNQTANFLNAGSTKDTFVNVTAKPVSGI
jgi:hypothetical protein